MWSRNMLILLCIFLHILTFFFISAYFDLFCIFSCIFRQISNIYQHISTFFTVYLHILKFLTFQLRKTDKIRNCAPLLLHVCAVFEISPFFRTSMLFFLWCAMKTDPLYKQIMSSHYCFLRKGQSDSGF